MTEPQPQPQQTHTEVEVRPEDVIAAWRAVRANIDPLYTYSGLPVTKLGREVADAVVVLDTLMDTVMDRWREEAAARREHELLEQATAKATGGRGKLIAHGKVSANPFEAPKSEQAEPEPADPTPSDPTPSDPTPSDPPPQE